MGFSHSVPIGVIVGRLPEASYFLHFLGDRRLR